MVRAFRALLIKMLTNTPVTGNTSRRERERERARDPTTPDG